LGSIGYIFSGLRKRRGDIWSGKFKEKTAKLIMMSFAEQSESTSYLAYDLGEQNYLSQ